VTRDRHTGRCLCGEVRFVADGAPDMVAVCHCESCRRQTGAAFAAYADYRADRVAFAGRASTVHQSSPGVGRGFCGRCGSTISYQGANQPHMIHLHIGVFDDPGRLPPMREENVADRLCWLGPIIAEQD
jgi:hypothetical protein